MVSQIKHRPALVLRKMPPYKDLLLCGISTQLHQEVKGFDELLHANDPDFSKTGLRSASLIRLGFLSVLPARSIIGTLGTVDSNRHHKLLQRLADYLTHKTA